MRKPLTALAAFGAVLLIVGGAAAASVPDPSGVIHSCRKTSTGEIRVIDSASQTCPAGTAALNWSQTGPAGPVGPQGPAGVPGSGGGTVITTTTTFAVDPAPFAFTAHADCPAGTFVYSPGVAWISLNVSSAGPARAFYQEANNLKQADVSGSHPPAGVEAAFENSNGDASGTITIWVVCR